MACIDHIQIRLLCIDHRSGSLIFFSVKQELRGSFPVVSFPLNVAVVKHTLRDDCSDEEVCSAHLVGPHFLSQLDDSFSSRNFKELPVASHSIQQLLSNPLPEPRRLALWDSAIHQKISLKLVGIFTSNRVMKTELEHIPFRSFIPLASSWMQVNSCCKLIKVTGRVEALCWPQIVCIYIRA